MFQALVKGGWMMLPLLACSLVSVTIIIERFLFFRRIRKAHRAEEVLALVHKKRADEALAIAEEEPLPVMRVLRAGLTHARILGGHGGSRGCRALPHAAGPSRPRYHRYPFTAFGAPRHHHRHDQVLQHHGRLRHGPAPCGDRRGGGSARLYRRRHRCGGGHPRPLQLFPRTHRAGG